MMRKILILFLFLFNFIFASTYYCTSYYNDYTFADSTGTTSNSDFTGIYNIHHTSYYKTRGSYYESMTGCVEENKFVAMQVKYNSYSREQELICSQQHNFDNSEAMYACIDNVQNLLSSYSDLMMNYSDASPLPYVDMKCNELYFELETNNVYSCDPNTGQKNLIENGSITPDGNLSCGSSNYSTNIPNMVIGGSGYNWNTQDCVSKVHNEEIEGGTITTNYDDNGNIESSNYTSSTTGNTYTVENTENGLIGTIKDSSGNVIDTGSVTKDDNGDYHYISNSPTSGSSTSLNDFYTYTPTNNTNTGGTSSGSGNTGGTGTGTNTGGTTSPNNDTSLDGLNQNYVTPTTGTGGNSQTDVMNDLKGSVNSLNEQMKLNTLSNIGISSQLSQITEGLNGTANSSSFDTGSYETFLSNLGNSFTNIQGTFDDTKNILDNGFSFDASKYDNYTDCTMSTIAFGQTISIDYCTPFIPFRAFITFIVTMSLIYHSIRIFFWGLK